MKATLYSSYPQIEICLDNSKKMLRKTPKTARLCTKSD